MDWFKNVLIILTAYLLGSIPTALIYSRMTHGVDIRVLGDGNMGARNSKRTFGWYAGVLVALADIVKGALAVLLAIELDAVLEIRYLAGAAAVLGHDFPVFAKFKGGQGFATTTGVFLGLFPLVTLIGAAIYFTLFFIFRNSDLAASIGMGFIALTTYLFSKNIWIVLFIVVMLLFIPLKKWLDRKRTGTGSEVNQSLSNHSSQV